MARYIVYTLFFLVLSACGTVQGQPGRDGKAGQNGIDGINGLDGVDGHSALLKSVTVPIGDPTCQGNGGYVILGGTDLNDDGTLETGETTLYAAVCNGSKGDKGDTGATGAQGPAGLTPQFTPVSVVEPCGHASSAYKEALLGLQGGGLFGSFSASGSALTVRDTLIPDGSYYDTDDSECYFTVVTDGHGDRTVTWNGTSGSGHHYPAGYAYFDAGLSTWTIH